MIKLTDLLIEGVRDPGIFKGIFLAGGPGSGKTYVAQKLFGIPDKVNVSKYGLKMVNQDTELEMFLKKYFGTFLAVNTWLGIKQFYFEKYGTQV